MLGMKNAGREKSGYEKAGYEMLALGMKKPGCEKSGYEKSWVGKTQCESDGMKYQGVKIFNMKVTKSYVFYFNCGVFSQLNLVALKFVTISSADETYSVHNILTHMVT